jgi:magnesium chelatase accessory protein
MRAPTLPADWPHRDASRHIPAARHLWHIQEMGAGPLLILIHGTGGASHSFRHLIPWLTPHYRVIALDLPGQGFSVLGPRAESSLTSMARDIALLVQSQGWQPHAIIGHSAGAAVALQLSELIPTDAVIGINAALAGFDGVSAWLFPILARGLALLPFVPQVFSKLAGNPQKVRDLLTTTGSKLDAAGEAQYLHLLQSPAHVAGTLAMMAQWNFDALLRKLPQIKTPCLLITAENDRAVPPLVSDRAASQLPNATRGHIPQYGHLVHEEAADLVATQIINFLHNCQTQGVAIA